MQGMGRFLIFTAFALLLSACGDEKGAQVAKAPPPNVIYIVANDLGLSHVSAYGGVVPTPNIDSLARDGVLFKSAYAASPNAAPSRAALMTGRYPVRFGFEYDNEPADRALRQGLGLSPDETTIAELLKGQGYKTAAVGIWQLGLLREHYPTLRGFDYFYGVRTGHTPALRPSAEDFIHAPSKDYPISPTRSRRNSVMEGMPPRQILNDDVLLSDDLANQAVRVIESHAAQTPFFLYYGLNAPHTPLITTSKYYDRFAHIENHQERVYAAMVSAVDDAVGRVLDALKRTGLDKNTLVVFTSVAGCDPASGQCGCTIAKGGKGSVFEGGVKMPLLMRWPLALPAGQVYDKPVSLMDVTATVVSVQKHRSAYGIFFDGVDLRPYLKDPAREPHKVLYWVSRPIFAAMEDGYKLIYDDSGRLQAQLYNIEEDPLEREDLAGRRLEKVLQLRSRIDPWRSEISQPSWQPQSIDLVEMCGDETLVAR
ncbi:MAG: sulfatase-like hydrolase/transferase [Sphingomonadales bacterium]|jgi:arylsulfatase A-like enzyme